MIQYKCDNVKEFNTRFKDLNKIFSLLYVGVVHRPQSPPTLYPLWIVSLWTKHICSQSPVSWVGSSSSLHGMVFERYLILCPCFFRRMAAIFLCARMVSSPPMEERFARSKVRYISQLGIPHQKKRNERSNRKIFLTFVAWINMTDYVWGFFYFCA